MAESASVRPATAIRPKATAADVNRDATLMA